MPASVSVWAQDGITSTSHCDGGSLAIIERELQMTVFTRRLRNRLPNAFRVACAWICALMFPAVTMNTAPVAVTAAEVECTVAALQAKAPKDTTLTSAKVVPAAGNL